MAGNHASTMLLVSMLHHTINTSATVYKKLSVDMVMEIENLALLGHGGLKLIQAVRK
jgi:hypothetical protein